MSLAARSPGSRQYPHLDDLVEESNIDPQKHASIKRWVDEARAHFNGFEFQAQLYRPDNAYLNFVRAAQIITDVIPSNKEFPTFAVQKQNPVYREFISLQKIIGANWGKAENFKDEVKENNREHGTLRKSEVRRLETQKLEAQKLEAQKHNRQESLQSSKANGVTNGENPGNSPTPSRQKRAPPPVRPKPVGISAQPLATDGKPNGPVHKSIPSRPTSPEARNTPDDLAARFGALRSSGSVSLQLTNAISSTPSLQPLVSTTGANPAPRGRPISGRELPISPRLDMSLLNGLPRPPSPTYSPARNSISPARSIPRKPMTAPTALNLTDETILSPSALSAYISRSTEVSLLVLDVRERTEYDEGHIPAKSIICIEPLQLRQDGISGDHLEELISISPTPREHELFSKRQTYDLVVYHDHATPSDAFLHERNSDEHLIILKRLHQALCDFSYDKPLKRPPLLLSGGLKAWTDLFGHSSLVLGDSRPSSPPPRSSAVGLGISSLSRAATPISNKVGERNKGSDRKTDEKIGAFDINIEEEQAWLQKLQDESGSLAVSVPKDSGTMDVKRQRRSTSIVRVPATEFPRNVEQFFQRFPASPSVQQSMMTPIPGTPAVSAPLTPIFASKRYTIIDHPFYGFTDVRNPDFNPPASPVRPPPAVPRKSYKGESEKPPFRLVKPPLPPKESPMVGHRSTFAGDLVSTGTPNNFGTVGLQNLGNTCYMNSILQCMNGSIPLARYFLDGSYKMHINKENPQGSKGVLVEAFATVVKHLWEGKYKFVSPMSFKEICGGLRDTFAGSDQQDAQEFLEFFLDFLHEDLNPNANKSNLRDLTLEEEANRERLPVPYTSWLEWQRYTHRNYSVVVNWFQGQFSSRLMCLTCNTRSTTYNQFMFLSIPIPPGKRNPTLQDCIDEFCREEVLADDNMWHCPRCKKNRHATKKIKIVRLPHMLIVHLKRFQRRERMGRGVWTEKIMVPVDFPCRGLTLDKYVPVMGGDGVGMGSQGLAEWTPPPEMMPPFEYDMYGVVNHFGGLQGGHYTSFVRDMWGEGWREFDDSKSKRIPEETIFSRETQSSAYILFFVRSHIM
ncbi:cysteine proteinase [Terfezia boudieri ATCC MYA-4762]|uniref:ubiquitinyl hydrolase 1 n=1 Tax=Terfezia boudieri ATCC MYA-4762 TaxID=1051890 RepID=A0A3N4LDH7_9PEZI|nr:cysteine proteinase [Terfezia boudieri ATCC MYA-4762]